MQIIPVIDIKQGQVVHAVKGKRNQYVPVQSKLCVGSDPVNIIAAFLELYPFSTVYIADLDAILGQGDNEEIINTICSLYPQLTFWLDSGISRLEQIKNKKMSSVIDVIGTETGVNIKELYNIKKHCPDIVLSLDYNNGQLLGDPSILISIKTWQKKIIVMPLDNVGSGTGPDMECIKSIYKMSQNKNIYAAGGISSIKDLESLQQQEINGALIATAFHTGNISGKEIELVTSDLPQVSND